MDEQRSSADPAGRVSAQDMRASHAERDQAVETIRAAGTEGRLTPGEADQRVTAALAARTLGELAALTRDLPGRTEDLLRIEKGIGSAELAGTWVVPRRMEIKLTVGNARFDFTDATVTHGLLTLDVDLGIGGDLLLITRPGIVVAAEDVDVRRGELKLRPARQDPEYPVDLRIEVTGRLRGGDLVVRYPR